MRLLFIPLLVAAVLAACWPAAGARAQQTDVISTSGCFAVCGAEQWFKDHSQARQDEASSCLSKLERARATEQAAFALKASGDQAAFSTLIERRTEEIRAFIDCANEAWRNQLEPEPVKGLSCRAVPQDSEQLGRYSPAGLADIRQADPPLQYMAGLLKGYAQCQEEELRNAPLAVVLQVAAHKWKLAAQFTKVFCAGGAAASIARELQTRAQPGQTIYDVGISDGRLICSGVAAAKALGPIKQAPVNEPAPGQAGGRGVWDISTSQRGFQIELAWDGNLPPGFPTIDRVQGPPASPTEITSIKSMDLAAPSYQRPGGVFSTLWRYMNTLNRFTGATRGGVTVAAGPQTRRTLLVAIPPDAVTAAQMSEISDAMREAANLGIGLDVRNFP
jgi:hypothetical protein